MPTSRGYSLSSAPTDAACTTKKKRVSAQLSRLMGSTSRVSGSEADSRRRLSHEDGPVIAARRHSITSGTTAASSMSHMPRRLGHTSGLLPVIPSNNLSHARSNWQAAPISQPASQLETEFHMLRFGAEPSSSHHLHAAPAPAPNSAAGRHEVCQSPSTRNTFLYDEFELSCLQELLETDKDNPSKYSSVQQQQQQVSHEDLPYAYTSSTPSCSSSSSPQIKPLSAIHRLFKRLFASLHNSTGKSGRAETASGLSTELLHPRKRGGMQHVEIHTHHHYYHHHRRSLVNLPVYESAPAPAHPQGFGTRRRRHSESCSKAAGRTLSF